MIIQAIEVKHGKEQDAWPHLDIKEDIIKQLFYEYGHLFWITNFNSQCSFDGLRKFFDSQNR